MATTTMAEHVGGRVLVAVAQPSGADELFDLALRLAARRRLHVLALVREATGLMTAAALPFVEEIDRCSGARLPFDAAAATRAIDRLMRDCELQLRARARDSRIEFALEAVHGPLVGHALAALAADDVLLLGSCATWTSPGRRAQSSPRHRVGAIGDGGLDDRTVQTIAADMLASGERVIEGIARFPAQTLTAATEVPIACDVLLISRQGAIEHGAGLQRFLGAPRRVVVVLP